MREKYELWNMRSLFLSSIFVIIVISSLMVVIGHHAIYSEIESSLVLISAALFLLLAFGLYRGVRLPKHRLKFKKWKGIGRDWDKYDMFDPSIGFFEAGDGILGVIMSIVLWIVVSIIVFFLLVMIANLLWGMLSILGVVLYWLYYRALRLALVKSRICRRNLWKSIGYALLYTLLYTGWLYLLVWGSKLALHH